jgi:MAE_28990/MAE_18760-like HEPN
MVIANEKTSNRSMCIRAAVTLLYAHWEGAVKQAAGYYLEFVSRQRLRNQQLARHFLAMAVRKLLHPPDATTTIQPYLDVVEFFQSQLANRNKINGIGANLGVNTKSNLKSAVFREIVTCLGLDYSRFATKEKLIDEKLLANRNQIAHGRYLLVSHGEYLDLHDEILGIMQELRNQIENAAFTGAYLQRNT